ncbi:deoxyribonuclease TATDN1 [Chlorella sorokiniana]|uniref:Deoxyribonuclease TATDN1 n=1 Tax=Chlorella sorokiniana TaxID=3076 RepID=A0A2P6TY71_CHLSO|nr:deoxyribonuclease TATDN1 [Chlorella sorokiniana]|eukprot:PRW59015.1 deoxyribonuclease TATDN1 [Chlorella sorokiniana]
MYSGCYNGKEYHAPDLQPVLQRAFEAGVERLIITAGNLEEARKALALARTHERLYSTVGVHPTRCGEFEAHPGGPDAYMAELQEVLRDGMSDGKVVAVGETGLDYDRLHFCDAATQRTYFARQFELARSSGLPMFLHLRAAAAAFLDIVHQHADAFPAGVVHSFDGSLEELQQILQHDKLSIGINGCSLKAEENLQVMAAVPVERLLLETDCPWCEIRPSHAGSKYVQTKWEAKDKKKQEEGKLVKSRNEPCCIVQVLEVVAGHRGIADRQQLAEQVYGNTLRLFFPADRPETA